MRRLQAERFEDCMDVTLPQYGPVKVATSEQRLKAAEICGQVTTN